MTRPTPNRRSAIETRGTPSQSGPASFVNVVGACDRRPTGLPMRCMPVRRGNARPGARPTGSATQHTVSPNPPRHGRRWPPTIPRSGRIHQPDPVVLLESVHKIRPLCPGQPTPGKNTTGSPVPSDSSWTPKPSPPGCVFTPARPAAFRLLPDPGESTSQRAASVPADGLSPHVPGSPRDLQRSALGATPIVSGPWNTSTRRRRSAIPNGEPARVRRPAFPWTRHQTGRATPTRSIPKTAPSED
jgi:hypothetical protein